MCKCPLQRVYAHLEHTGSDIRVSENYYFSGLNTETENVTFYYYRTLIINWSLVGWCSRIRSIRRMIAHHTTLLC